MAIKYRDGRAYYYESVRQGDRVVSNYVGSGDLAIAAAMVHRERHQEAEASREAWREDVARMRSEDDRAGELSRQVEAILREALQAAGYHRHRRGEWRKRRDGGDPMAKANDKAQDDVIVPTDREERYAILKRAQGGDKAVLPVVRAMFDEKPALVESFGNLAAFVEQHLVGSNAGKDVAVREALGRKVEALRAELAGPRPSPIERLLAERAVVCWMRLYQAEWVDATAEGRTLAQADFHRRRVDSMHRRYLSALKTLATVRKLALPALQVNVAENQVVIGGT